MVCDSRRPTRLSSGRVVVLEALSPQVRRKGDPTVKLTYLSLVAVLLAASATAHAAIVTFTFPLTLERLGCTEFVICRLPGPDPASLTLQLDLVDPFASQALDESAVSTVSYGGPFRLYDRLDVRDFTATYAYDRLSGDATLDVTAYWIGAPGIASDVSISDSRWQDVSQLGLWFYIGTPSILLPAITFVGSPIPLPAALPLFLSALAGLGLMGLRRKMTV